MKAKIRLVSSLLIKPIIVLMCYSCSFLIKQSTVSKSIKTSFKTDYGQFYIVDTKNVDKLNNFVFNTSDLWDEKAFELGVSTKERGIGILLPESEGLTQIVCNIEVLNRRIDFEEKEDYSTVLECSMSITEQELQLRDCPFLDVKGSLKVENGHYRLRVYHYEENDHANAKLRILIWPEALSKAIILK